MSQDVADIDLVLALATFVVAAAASWLVAQKDPVPQCTSALTGDMKMREILDDRNKHTFRHA